MFIMDVIALLVTLVSLILGDVFAAKSLKKEPRGFKKALHALRSLTAEDEERIKNYATIFGVDSNSHNFNNLKLLEMGEKAEQAVGTTRLREMIQEIQDTYVTQRTVDSSSHRHKINVLIMLGHLIAKYTEGIKYYLMGGVDLDGEGAASIH